MNDYDLPGELEAAGRRDIVVPLPKRSALPYAIARRIAETAQHFSIVRVGPRVVAALILELDLREAQVDGLMDQLIQSGDSLLAVNRARRAAEAEAARHAEVAAKLAVEAQRLRDRLAALSPEVPT